MKLVKERNSDPSSNSKLIALRETQADKLCSSTRLTRPVLCLIHSLDPYVMAVHMDYYP